MEKNKMPKGLKPHGQAFWNTKIKEEVWESAHDLERLDMLAKLVDEIDADDGILQREGRFVRDRYGSTREHPAVKSLRDNRTLFCRIVRDLGLDLATPEDSRPPRQY